MEDNNLRIVERGEEVHGPDIGVTLQPTRLLYGVHRPGDYESCARHVNLVECGKRWITLT